MSDSEPEPAAGGKGDRSGAEIRPDPADQEGRRRGRSGRVAIIFALLFLSGGAGFGIGLLARPTASDPPLTRERAFDRARRQVERETARSGLAAGRRSGLNHGIIAGGMAAESDATVEIRELRADAAATEAASAQAELSGMTAAPAVPAPAPEPSAGE